MTTKTINRRHRIGYGWTSTPVRAIQRGLTIAEPTEEMRGGWLQIAEAHYAAARLNIGNDWHARIFVDGKPIAERPADVFYAFSVGLDVDVTFLDDK